MTRPADYLYDLLPAIYRMRDEAHGFALRDLLGVIGEQVNVIEADIDRLYDNWFIETCEDWVVPYLGDLVGYRLLSDAGVVDDVSSASARRRGRVLIPRRDVANTVAFRRRKGTLALLEVLAHDVAGWPARAIEFFPLLGWTQQLDHQHPERGQFADLRLGDALDRVDGPFDVLAHGVDARRPSSHRTVGRHNIPSVGVFVWRLSPYSITRSPAACIEREGSHCFTFSVLGNDTPLYNLPVAESDPTHIADETNVPTPIRRLAFEHRISEHPLVADASTSYYGAGRSLQIEVADWPRRGAGGPIPPELVIPTDLSQWHAYAAPRGRVLVDPSRGRMVFANGQAPRRVVVSYHYGFSADMGAGEYQRPISQPADCKVYRVSQQHHAKGQFRTIQGAWKQWRKDKGAPVPEGAKPPQAAVIEVGDSGVYEERLEFELEPGESLQLRAASGTRPVLRLLDYRVDQPDPFRISGAAASRFVLEGFLVAGRGILIAGPEHGENDHVHGSELDERHTGEADGGGDDGDEAGELCDVAIRHCTLVPGWDLDCDCSPGRPDEPSLTLSYTRTKVVVEHSILGSVQVDGDERRGDPATLLISDSIIDATSPDGLALSDDGGRVAYAAVRILRSTVIGEVRVHAILLAENSIFTSRVTVARRQVGCIRYSHVPSGSRTPRRYGCQPDLAAQQAEDDLRTASAGPVEPGTVDRARARAVDRVRPSFTSLRYGTPGYAQLDDAIDSRISRGADDESELGAFHDLYQPQRAANLWARLDEYTPAGMDAGIFYAS